jgi:hypothetical protein
MACPKSRNSVIQDLDAELICMTMVHSLGEEHSHFASSLMLLKFLDKSELQAAFLAEESQCRHPSGKTLWLFVAIWLLYSYYL